jgi:hypothetical protein
MAYTPSSLSALNYANGFTLWHYRTADTGAIVDNIGYFNPAADMLRIGDFIFVHTGVGAVPNYGVMVVVDNTGGVVDLTNITAFGSANVD